MPIHSSLIRQFVRRSLEILRTPNLHTLTPSVGRGCSTYLLNRLIDWYMLTTSSNFIMLKSLSSRSGHLATEVSIEIESKYLDKDDDRHRLWLRHGQTDSLFTSSQGVMTFK